MIKWYHDHCDNKHATARHFNIERKSIQNWVDAEEKLTKIRGVGKKKRRLSHGKPLSSELDVAVLDFLISERATGSAVSNKIKHYALKPLSWHSLLHLVQPFHVVLRHPPCGSKGGKSVIISACAIAQVMLKKYRKTTTVF